MGPLSGGSLPLDTWKIVKTITDALFLQPPQVMNSFAGTPYPVLNGSAWTIAYEFRCYILILCMGVAMLLKSRRIVVAAAALFTILALCFPIHPYHPYQAAAAASELTALQYLRILIIGDYYQLARFIQIFLTGSCFYIFRDQLRFPTWAIITASLALVASCFSIAFVHIGFAIFGGYLLLAFATLNRTNIFSRINNKNDISYGLYLSAWPIEKLLIWWFPTLPLIVLGLATLLLACGYGWLSWRLVEQPIVKLSRRSVAASINGTKPHKIDAVVK